MELRTTACGRGTTARFYIRPGEIAYDRAGPMAHDVEAMCAPRRCGLRRPAVHGPAARSGEHAVLGCAAAGSTGTDRRRAALAQAGAGRRRAALAQAGAGPRRHRPAQGRVGAGRRRAASAQTSAGPRWRRPAQGRVGTDQRRAPQAGVVTPISTGWNAVVTPPPSLEARSHHGNLSRAAPAPARRHLTRPADVHGSSGQASAWALRRSPLLRCAPVGSGALAQPGPLRRRLPGSHLGALSQS